MHEFQPTLDRATLQRLARVVRELRSAGQAVPARQLVALAGAAPAGGAVTIDFEAVEGLGQPLVVLRVGPAAAGPLAGRLTGRGQQVAALVAEGRSNKQIARRLGITLATVKDHIHRLLARTGLPNRAALAAAYRGPADAGLS